MSSKEVLVASAMVYLASDASNYTTGAEIIIDSGLLLLWLYTEPMAL